MTTFTLTLHLPDDLAARLATLPQDEVNAFAVAALADLVSNGLESNGNEGDDELTPGELTPDDLAAIGAGLADLDAGRVKPAAAVFAGMDAHLAELKRTKQQQQTA
jgi:predicted transcriptional regulator